MVNKVTFVIVSAGVLETSGLGRSKRSVAEQNDVVSEKEKTGRDHRCPGEEDESEMLIRFGVRTFHTIIM